MTRYSERLTIDDKVFDSPSSQYSIGKCDVWEPSAPFPRSRGKGSEGEVKGGKGREVVRPREEGEWNGE